MENIPWCVHAKGAVPKGPFDYRPISPENQDNRFPQSIFYLLGAIRCVFLNFSRAYLTYSHEFSAEFSKVTLDS